MKNDDPNVVCRGTLTIEVRLLSANELPNKDLYQPKEDFLPWWTAPQIDELHPVSVTHGTRLTRTPLRATRFLIDRGSGLPRSIRTAPQIDTGRFDRSLPHSDTGLDYESERSLQIETHRFVADREVKVRVRAWDRTHTRLICSVDKTGVHMGMAPFGVSKKVVSQDVRNQERRNK